MVSESSNSSGSVWKMEWNPVLSDVSLVMDIVGLVVVVLAVTV